MTHTPGSTRRRDPEDDGSRAMSAGTRRALRYGLLAVFVGFTAFSVYAVSREGFWSVFPPFRTLAELQMFLDIGMAQLAFQIWLWFDLKRQGRSAWWWFAVSGGIALGGSISTLLYLLCLGPFGFFRRPPADASTFPQGK